MTKYRVYLEAVASVSVEVEAESQEEAVDLAHDHTPSASWGWPDMGDWYFPPYESLSRQPLRVEDFIEEVD